MCPETSKPGRNRIKTDLLGGVLHRFHYSPKGSVSKPPEKIWRMGESSTGCFPAKYLWIQATQA
jgi:hypothetical protein